MRHLLIILSVLLITCSAPIEKMATKTVKHYENQKEIENWIFKTPTDSSAGINIDSALVFLKNKKFEKVIVAVIDGVINVNHEDLKNVIYTNPKEIDGNEIDDDNNGYIDDVHGWNYVGRKDGSSLIYGITDTNRELKRLFNEHKVDSANYRLLKDNVVVNEIDELMLSRQDDIDYAQRYIDWGDKHRVNYYNMFKFFPKVVQSGDTKTNIEWDSILSATDNVEKKEAISTWLYFKDNDNSLLKLEMKISRYYAAKYFANNLDLDAEKNIDNKGDVLEYTGYGNGFVGSQNSILKDDHGTQIAGLIGADFNNGLGLKGVCPNVEIMPLEVFTLFNERTKDFINAVKYAADNGAKIINYSGSKGKSIQYKKEYYEAIKYAIDKGVLFVSSAGNSGLNLDSLRNDIHPIITKGKGFMTIGASIENLDKGITRKSSNYGKETVDIFAPGDSVPVLGNFEKKYITSYGTSNSAALVSGLAALIWSYYPNFTSEEIESIIKESGRSYDVIVQTKTEEVNFNEMSQSGKIIDCYKAVVLADKRYKDRELDTK